MAERLHHDIHHLRRMLLEMGGLVDAQLRRATQALLGCNRAMAQHAIALDGDVDLRELRIYEACVRLIGLSSLARGVLERHRLSAPGAVAPRPPRSAAQAR